MKYVNVSHNPGFIYRQDGVNELSVNFAQR